MKKTKRKKRHKKHRRTSYEQDRHEGDLPRSEYSWLSGVNDAGGPQNPSGIPPNLRGISESPDLTVAWILRTCKFAEKEND